LKEQRITDRCAAIQFVNEGFEFTAGKSSHSSSLTVRVFL
jgi:hypothetical protein